MRGSSLNLYLFSAFGFLTIFLLPLSYVGLMLIVIVVIDSCGVVSYIENFHDVAIIAGSSSFD